MRDAPRLHVEADLAPGVELALDADRAHYLLHVMRVRAGDPVRVFNAAGGEWRARVAGGADAPRRPVVLRVDRQTRPALAAATRFAPVLLFALLKRDATDTLVRMATELGSAAIRPVLTARTVGNRVNGARLALIAREAAEQCERLDVPAIGEPVTLRALLDGWDPDVAIALAVERADAAPLGAHGSRPGAVLIGPEGGWAPDELDLLGRAAFVQPVTLGALVLRAETAAVAALAALGAAHGWVGVTDVEPG